MRLNEASVIRVCLGQGSDTMKQHRLPDTTQTDRDEALCGSAQPGSPQRDAGLLQQVLTPCQLWGLGACAGQEGIKERIHCYGLYQV